MHAKIQAEKVSKNNENSIQNDAKMDAKINDFSYLFEKGEKPRNYLKTNRILGFRHAKRYQKSIKNRCKIDARKRHAKSMENDAKMHPKWDTKSIQNLKNTGKNSIRKLMPKFDAKKTHFFSSGGFWIDFGSIFWLCRGVRGAVDT